MTDTLNLIADVLLLVACAGTIGFAGSYVSFFAWRKTQAGRALLAFSLSLVSVILLAALAVWTNNEYPFREYIRVTVYAGLAVTVWRLLIVLWRSWRAGDARLNIHPREKEKSDV